MGSAGEHGVRDVAAITFETHGLDFDLFFFRGGGVGTHPLVLSLKKFRALYALCKYVCLETCTGRGPCFQEPSQVASEPSPSLFARIVAFSHATKMSVLLVLCVPTGAAFCGSCVATAAERIFAYTHRAFFVYLFARGSSLRIFFLGRKEGRKANQNFEHSSLSQLKQPDRGRL